MKAYGTEVLLTPAADGFSAAVAKTEELAHNFWLLPDVSSTTEANPAIHYQTTRQEIIKTFDGKTRCLHQWYWYWWYDYRCWPCVKEVNKEDVKSSGLNLKKHHSF